MPFREFRGDSASRVLISACLSAYPGCQKSAFPRIQGARNQRLQGARNQRCGVYFGLAPRVGVERVQLFVGVGASSWCNFFRLRSPRGPLRRAFFFPGRFFGCASLVGAPAGGRAGGVALKSITSKGTPFEGSHPRGCAPRGARRGGQLQSGTSKRNRGTLRIPEADPPRGTRRGGPPRRAPRGGMDELF